MSGPTPPDIYSEDSVFRKLFSETKKPKRPTQSERLAKIFSHEPSQNTSLDVADFLPSG